VTASVITPWLIHTVTVYGVGSSGAYDQVIDPALRCRVKTLRGAARGLPTVGLERTELDPNRGLIFEPNYVLDEHHQIEFHGLRYNVLFGSQRDPIGPDDQVAYQVVDLVRVIE
jgi:hypothetical protein